MTMKVRGRDKLHAFCMKHNQARGVVEAWYDDVSRAEWVTPQDIKGRYRSADFLAHNRVIFNLKGNFSAGSSGGLCRGDGHC
ncbi:type II toxin-antitoxin system HigB family toxin [Prodigiosinella confusarubida]|uniref:type II toxin-antitoxin system HigB family toxin n=1 Tax=Serratia sp. (strain ATCC 39006) TaxID=104623 RepID=UPI0003926520|nr:type II toxin-antitoxin system HigB family toxin [Serratia sp. ATCC 39006]